MSVTQPFSKDFEQMMLYDSREKARRDSLEFQKEVAARNQREARAEIQRLRAGWKAEAARADAAEAELARRDAELARRKDELARLDAELARRDEERARLDAALAALRPRLGRDA